MTNFWEAINKVITQGLMVTKILKSFGPDVILHDFHETTAQVATM